MGDVFIVGMTVPERGAPGEGRIVRGGARFPCSSVLEEEVEKEEGGV